MLKQTDDFYFTNDSFQDKSENDANNQNQFITMDSSLPLIGNNEDDFTIEQTKMIETLMNIVEFIIK